MNSTELRVPVTSTSRPVAAAAVASLNCPNITKLLEEYLLNQQAAPVNASVETTTEVPFGQSDQDALIYIVVVLAFYSFGIVFMMIKYMRKEQREMEETKLYQQYMKAARERWMHNTSRGRLCNRLALQALNTVNAIPQTTQNTAKVTFV